VLSERPWRADKRTIAQQLSANLKARALKGPEEPALDAYIAELDENAGALNEHVEGHVEADAARLALLARLDGADVEVDTWYRHIEGFLYIEAHRRSGVHVPAAAAAYEAAFPDGLGHVDDPVPVENELCKQSLAVLASPEHAATLQAIELPPAWLPKWKAAIAESDAAYADLEASRQKRQLHIGLGRDAETDWVEIMVRLRKYVSSRAKKGDTARILEGRQLLAPLLEKLAQMGSQSASRATRRAHAKQEAGGGGENVPAAVPVTAASVGAAPAASAASGPAKTPA
jgi:hypothetical protein